MKYDFAALRFTEDKNLADKVYWYVTELPLSEGERVLAPVGPHDRLQAARVEKTVSAEEGDAPYDLRLIKAVTARYGARKLVLGNCELLEFGGVRYDGKHYTPFGKLVLVKELPADLFGACVYGVTNLFTLPASDPVLYREIAHASGGVLLAGEEGEKTFRILYALLRGETHTKAEEEAEVVSDGETEVSFDGETARLLREKLQ